jgi:hypothetical protein
MARSKLLLPVALMSLSYGRILGLDFGTDESLAVRLGVNCTFCELSRRAEEDDVIGFGTAGNEEIFSIW